MLSRSNSGLSTAFVNDAAKASDLQSKEKSPQPLHWYRLAVLNSSAIYEHDTQPAEHHIN